MLQRLRGIKNYGRMLIIESGWSAYGYSLYYSSNVSKCFKFFINKKRNSKIIKVGNLMGQEEVPQIPCRIPSEDAREGPRLKGLWPSVWLSFGVQRVPQDTVNGNPTHSGRRALHHRRGS